jgi:hypothetical protein
MEERRKAKNGALIFPRAALVYLKNAGWTPQRIVPIPLYEQAYAAEGLPLLPKTKLFLRKFGGLIIRYTTKSEQEDVLEFLAERAALGMGGSGIECFEELTGVTPLCPIGHYLFGTCMLFMDSRGQVLGGSDETVTLIGRTGQEAISNILTGVESKVVDARAT